MVLDGNRTRDYQLVAKLHSLGKPALCLVEHVFRGSGKKKGRPKLSEVALPAHLCVRVHLVMLEPVSSTVDTRGLEHWIKMLRWAAGPTE